MNIQQYINAVTIYNNKLIYTICNDNYLYQMDMKNKKIEKIVAIPCKTNNAMKFSSLVIVRDEVWMIPWKETIIYVYNFLTKKMYLFPLPNESEMKEDKVIFRKAIYKDDSLWLLPRLSQHIIEINTREYSYKIYNQWPQNVVFQDNAKLNFYNMALGDDKLYMFAKDCNCSVSLDLKAGTIKCLDFPIQKSFATIIENMLVVSPINRGDDILVYSLEHGELLKKIEVPEWVFVSGETYAYWYVHGCRNKVVFMPFEANAVLLLDICTWELVPVKTDIFEYATLQKFSNFAGYEVCEWDGKIILSSHQGNLILILNDDGTIYDKIECWQSIGESRQSTSFHIVNEEDRNNEIRDFIKNVLTCEKKMWKNYGEKREDRLFASHWEKIL